MGNFLAIVRSRLAQLIQNQKFRDSLGSKLGISSSMTNNKFLQQVREWMESNPLKTQAVLATSLSVIPSALPTIFQNEELAIVAEELQNVDFQSGEYTDNQKQALEAMTGDRKEGYFGKDVKLVLQNTDLVVASLDKTSKIARLFGLRESDVEEAVMLIQSYELTDGEIFRKFKGR